MRRLQLFGIIALLTVASRVAQAQTGAGLRAQTAPPVKPQKAGKAAASLASISAELDRLQQQIDDLRRQVAALKADSERTTAKP